MTKRNIDISEKNNNVNLEDYILLGIKNVLEKVINDALSDKGSLNEKHAVRMWHYTSFEQGLSIIKQNEFKLSQNDDPTDECKYYHNGEWYDECGELTDEPKYMLCATRIKDSRVGFSSSFQYGFIQDGYGICRIELDENTINNAHSLVIRTEPDCVQHNPHINDYNTKKWKFKDTYDWCTSNWENQHEERILSKRPLLPNAIKYIRRVDFLIKNKDDHEKLKDVLKSNREFKDKVFVYTNMKDFNASR